MRPDPDLPSPGVPFLKVLNFGGAPFNQPASSLTFTMPDHSTLIVHLPAASVASFYQASFYIAADGSSHWAHAVANPVNGSLDPTLSPSAGLALGPAAP